MAKKREVEGWWGFLKKQIVLLNHAAIQRSRELEKWIEPVKTHHYVEEKKGEAKGEIC